MNQVSDITRRTLAAVLAPVAVLLGFAANLEAAPGRPIAFVNVAIVPMDSERVLSRQTVIVRDGHIAELGAADMIAVPKRALRIDGRGKFLMPGLTDTHAHLKSPHEFPLYLANGVTTVYNLGGRPAHLIWREQIARGELSGPTIYTCGPIIFRCGSADEARNIVEEQSRAGYDSIKIYNEVSAAAYPVLVETARSRNMLVVGHIPRAPGLEGVLEARQAIAHSEEYIYTFFKHHVEDESRIPEAVAATRAAEVPVILTLVNFDHILRQAEGLPALLARPETAYLAPWVRESWGPGRNFYQPRFKTPEQQQYLKQALAFQKTLTRAFNQAGVRVLAGTDAMNPGVVPGFSLHEELRLMVESGLTPFEALRTATRYPGEFLSSDAAFGTVAVGQRADLILLEANPLDDVRHVECLSGVMARGRWLPKAALKKALDQVPGAYAREERFVRSRLERHPEEALRYLGNNDPFNELAIKVTADLIVEKGLARFQELGEKTSRTEPATLLLQEWFINEVGLHLLRFGRRKEAIEVLQRNTLEFPRSANAWDSLADAHLENGDKELAVQLYRKALEIEPNFVSSMEALRRLTP